MNNGIYTIYQYYSVQLFYELGYSITDRDIPIYLIVAHY